MRLQNDDLDIPARPLVTPVQPIPAADPKSHAAQEVFTGRDDVERTDSAPSALYEVWLARHLGNAFKKAVLKPEAAAAMTAPDAAVMLNALEKPEALLASAQQRHPAETGALTRHCVVINACNGPALARPVIHCLAVTPGWLRAP